MNTRELKAQLESKRIEFESRAAKKQDLMQALKAKGTKFDADAVIAIDQNQNGEIFFLERGNDRAGYKHVLSHATDFKNKGVKVAKLPAFLMHTMKTNQQVGMQGEKAKRGGRPIYRGTLFAQRNVEIDVAISAGSNGFIVGANPTTLRK